MAKNSEYYKNLKEKKLLHFRKLEKELPEYVRTYLDNMIVDYQPNTLIAYAGDMLTFFKFLKEMNPLLKNAQIKDFPIDVINSLTAQDIIEYRNYLSFNVGENPHENISTSIERRMAPLRGFLSQAAVLGYIDHDPSAQLKTRKKKADKKEIVYLERDEVNSLMETVEKTKMPSKHQKEYVKNTKMRDTAILTLLFNTGIRVSECVGIDLDDVSFTNNSVKVVRKGGAEQHVYFNENTASALSDYINGERLRYIPESGEKALFLSSQRKRMTVRAVEYMVKKYAKIAAPDKKISPHKARSSFATELYQQTSDIRLVADVLGHEDVSVTARRYSAAKSQNRQKAGKLDIWS